MRKGVSWMWETEAAQGLRAQRVPGVPARSAERRRAIYRYLMHPFEVWGGYRMRVRFRRPIASRP